jgi:hypothetical protein
MRVASCPTMEAPVALIEQDEAGPGGAAGLRLVLLFREGILSASVISALGRLLAHL